MITNQQYHTPGKLTKFMYRLMSGVNLKTYAGKCIGPAWNLLPEDKDNLPSCVEVEWLNLGCTIYRKEALPSPAFNSVFKGYSLMEDLSLSLEVAKKWKLFNVRNARLFHDSQPGQHKNSIYKTAKMELVNRHYIMTKVLARNTFSDHIKLIILQFFGIATTLSKLQGWMNLIPSISGKLVAFFQIAFHTDKGK